MDPASRRTDTVSWRLLHEQRQVFPPATAATRLNSGDFPPALRRHLHPDRDAVPRRFLDRQGCLSETIEHLVACGVHGVVVAGTTGECYAQTSEERVETMRFVAERMRGRLPLIVGTGAIRTEDSDFFAEAARETGADAILVATPPYVAPTPREIALHALAIQRAAGLPVMLYNYPGRMGVNMEAETLDRRGQNPAFCAIKESSVDPNRLHMLARDYPQIQLSCGMDDQALEFFAWGARSWVCAGSNFAPEAHIALYRACALEGDFARGRRIMSAMLPLMRVLEQGGSSSSASSTS